MFLMRDFARENETKKYFIEEGTVEFSNNKMLILTNTAINIKELNKTKKNKKTKKKKINNQ